MGATLIVPGIRNSEPQHWQSWLERKVPGAVRVMQSDWIDANLAHWTARVRRELNRVPGQVLIVAHSFGCLAAVQAAGEQPDRIAGAMFVAPAEPDKFNVSSLIPRHDLGFESIVVASRNDPWIDFESAAKWARRWGSDFVDAGRAGHINVASGFGPWPQGLALYNELAHASARQSLGSLQTANAQRDRTEDDFYASLGDII